LRKTRGEEWKRKVEKRDGDTGLAIDQKAISLGKRKEEEGDSLKVVIRLLARVSHGKRLSLASSLLLVTEVGGHPHR